MIGSTAEEFTTFTRQDLTHWARELNAAGIEPNDGRPARRPGRIN